MPENVPVPLLAAQLKRAVEASGEVVFLTDRAGVITYVNPQFTRVYGYAPDEVVGKVTPRILKSGAHSPQHYDRFWKSLVGGEVAHAKMVNRAKDGRLISIEGSANPIADEQGIVGFVAVQRDVTAHLENEEQHRLARFASDHAADAIFWVGQDGRIRYANDAAAEMLGHARDELCSMTVSDIAPSFTPDVFADHFGRNFPLGKVNFESSLRKKDGTQFAADITVTYQEVEGQAVSCAIVRDLTERRQLEAELRQAQKMEVVGQLAGGIAHEFNNLLTAILGYSELVSERVQDDPALRDDVAEIRKAGERASRLTRQLLAFSRKQILVPQIVDLNQVVSEFARMVVRVIGESIQVEVVAAASLGHTKVDPGQIEQLLMNLAVNARDAMPKGGRLTIATADVEIDADFAGRHPGVAPGPYVALRVTDTGSGIPPEVLPHVFEPFFTTKPLGKGTGLGLSTVFGIVKQSGGHVAIDSRLGTGTTVTSYLPRVDVTAESKEPPARGDRARTGIGTILLVEDEPAVREIARRALEARGYTVLAARDVADAIKIEMIHREPIHLLLSDIVMPELNGPDLAQRLVRRRPAMKVLYISGFAHHPALDLTGPRSAFLQKPFTPEVLALKVGELLARPADLDVGAEAER